MAAPEAATPSMGRDAQGRAVSAVRTMEAQPPPRAVAGGEPLEVSRGGRRAHNEKAPDDAGAL